MLVLAAGGDPHRALGPASPAVASLAVDLDDGARRAELTAGLEALAEHAEGLPLVAAALDRLRADAELAWGWLACALIADELDGEEA